MPHDVFADQAMLSGQILRAVRDLQRLGLPPIFSSINTLFSRFLSQPYRRLRATCLRTTKALQDMKSLSHPFTG